MTMVLAFGRNKQGSKHPLSAIHWADFRCSLLYHVRNYATLVADATGIGYDTTTGEQEDCFIMVLGDVSDAVAVQSVCANVAGLYDQKEYALVKGATEFVRAI